MVRLKYPCCSAEAHGSIGQGLIYATNKAGQYAKFMTSKKRKGTEAQIKVRHAYGQIATEWRGMTDEQKAVYHAGAVRNRHTDYNEFFQQRWPEVYEP